jgi:hypothetical protein
MVLAVSREVGHFRFDSWPQFTMHGSGKAEVPKSNEKWLEARDQVFDNLDHFIECFNNRLTLDNLRLVERYVKGELQLLLHFFAAVGGRSENYVAHLRFLPGFRGSVESISQAHHSSHIAEAPVDKELLHSFCRVDAMVNEVAGNDSAVLVHDVESVENPQQRLPSLARIDLADRFYNLFPEGLYWSEGIGFRRLGVVIDRELDPGFVSRDRSRGDKQKLIGQVIQSSSQGVNNFPNKGMSERGDIAQFGYVKLGVSRLLVKLGNDFVCAVFRPSPHLDFEITALFLGPFNTPQSESQSVRHESSVLREVKGYLPSSYTIALIS